MKSFLMKVQHFLKKNGVTIGTRGFRSITIPNSVLNSFLRKCIFNKNPLLPSNALKNSPVQQRPYGNLLHNFFCKLMKHLSFYLFHQLHDNPISNHSADMISSKSLFHNSIEELTVGVPYL